jgi:dCTP deaminase
MEENLDIPGVGGVLSRDELNRRLGKDLVISPLLERGQIGDGSVDISLGTRFLTSQRSEMTEIDFSSLTEEKIRSIQRSSVVPFGKPFVLHPKTLVLGCTFEFIAMPNDLCAFVLSRSAYGRAGLLIATATFVHPGWHGCLTLELENLGEIPITLFPLSTVGQLVMLHASQIVEPTKFKSLPVGPGYSGLAADPRWAKMKIFQKKGP